MTKKVVSKQRRSSGLAGWKPTGKLGRDVAKAVRSGSAEKVKKVLLDSPDFLPELARPTGTAEAATAAMKHAHARPRKVVTSGLYGRFDASSVPAPPPAASGMESCVCGHAVEEHGHDPKYPGSTACTECDCIAYEAGEEGDRDE